MKKTKKKIDKQNFKTSRRTVLKAAVAGAAATAFGFPSIIRSADDLKIVTRDPGGPFTPGFAKTILVQIPVPAPTSAKSIESTGTFNIPKRASNTELE